MDAVTRNAILGILAGMHERYGLSGLFITHDSAAAGALADRIAVLDAGQVVEERPTRQLLEDPRHPVTRALLRAALPDRAEEPVSGPAGGLR